MQKETTVNIKDNLIQLKDIFKLLLPQNKKELILLLVTIAIYFSYSLYIGLSIPAIIRGPAYLSSDTYFSFDNKAFFLEGFQNIEGHPLLILFTKQIVYLGNIFTYFTHSHVCKIILICLFCNYLIASSVIFVYRYLREVIELKGYILYLLTLSFAFFSTNMILCFTFESFTYSIFFLSFILYYYSSKIKRNEGISFFSSLSLAVIAGGITITNFAKGVAPIFFIRKPLIIKLKRIFAISLIFISILVAIEFAYGIIDKILERYEAFSPPSNISTLKYFDMFLGSPILLADIIVKDNIEPFPRIIILDYYQYIWQYIIIGAIIIFVCISTIINHKNKYIQMLILTFSVDIFIHLIMKYGIQDLFIYGAHWIYLFPLFLGWLAIKVPNKLLKLYGLSLTCIFLIITINNFAKLYDFIKLAKELYP